MTTEHAAWFYELLQTYSDDDGPAEDTRLYELLEFAFPVAEFDKWLDVRKRVMELLYDPAGNTPTEGA